MRGRVDATAIATLLASLPWMVGSLMVVTIGLWGISLVLGTKALLVPLLLLWLLSGLLMCLPAAEPYVARYLLGLREPTQDEYAVLQAAWHEVAMQAGIDPADYTLWVDDREALTSCLSGRHLMALPRTLIGVTARQRAAAAAHEVGHHLGGHVGARLLAQWYAAPSRLVVRGYRSVLRQTRRAGAVGAPALAAAGCVAAAVWLAIGAAVLFGLLTTPQLLPAVVVLPFLPWLSRWAERRCDRVAADLGYGRDLLDLFQWWEDSGVGEAQSGGVARQFFSSHPTVANRIHALRTYLTENGLT